MSIPTEQASVNGGARANRIAALLAAHFFNRQDRLGFAPPWEEAEVCPIKGPEDLNPLLLAHVLGECAPAVKVTWTTKRGKSGTKTGRFRLLSYSPDTKGNTRFGMADCDGGGYHGAPLKDPLGVAFQIQANCNRLGLRTWLEKSGGGAGWHVWILFANPVSAALVRKILFAVVPDDAMLADGSPADAHANRGIEVFPKQDRIGTDGLGNAIYLPWWSGAKDGGNRFYEVDDDGELVALDDLGDQKLVSKTELDYALAQIERGNDTNSRWLLTVPSSCVSTDFLLRQALAKAHYGLRNDTGLWLGCQLRDNGYTKEESRPVMTEYQGRVPDGPSPYTITEAMNTLESAFSRPARDAWAQKEKQKPQSDGTASPPPFSEAVGLATTCLADIKPQPVRWLVPSVLPRGKLGLFAGDGGEGKSTMTTDISACMTTGRPCLGLSYDAPPPCDVLLISCEDDAADTIVPRMLAAGADRRRIHRVDGIRTKDGKAAPFSLAHYEALQLELQKHPDIRLIIIDPAGAYIGKTVDDHKDSELRSLLGPLAETAAKYDVTILLIKHLTKGATVKAVHKVGGSAGYVNAVRAAFLIAPNPDDTDTKLLLPLKFNLGPKPRGLSYALKALEPEHRDRILGEHCGHLSPEDQALLGTQLYRVAWLGPIDADPDEVMRRQANQDKSAAKDPDKAAEWLNAFLSIEPVESSQCVEEGNKAIGARHDLKWWRDAVLKRRLGGKPRRVGFGAEGRWFFTLAKHPWPFHGLQDGNAWRFRAHSHKESTKECSITGGDSLDSLDSLDSMGMP